MSAWQAAEPILRDCVARSSLRKTAAIMGVSATTIARALKGEYGANGHRGDLPKLSSIVLEKLAGAKVDCPKLGEITANTCDYHKKQAELKSVTSGFHAEMMQACWGCSRFTGVRK